MGARGRGRWPGRVSATMARERDYVLGTHDEENERLGLQHRIWRPRVLEGWRRAGFTVGQTLVDVGCGPGHATLDLAEIVGPSGRVIALDRSRRFLDALEAARNRRGLDNIEAHELDLEKDEPPRMAADGAWERWVLTFLKRPRDVLERVGRSLKPGGALILHEYFDYSTWRLAPRSEPMEEFVSVVIETWRESGGEPDIALDMPRWLQELGFEIRSLTPFIDVVPATDYLWQWPKAFIEVGLRRLVELGRMSAQRAKAVSAAFAAAEAAPGTLMVTPAVLQIIAVR